MKSNHVFALTMALLFVYGCAPAPMGKTLLTNSSSAIVPETDTSTPEEGELSIQPDNENMSVSVDSSDRIEITGNCKDLDRKKNRIIVEAFAGEDETVLPYVSNSISNKCQTTASGLPVTDTCFWVTKGVGIIEDAGKPTERSFPQCHNGRFGFSVKLGKMLEGASAGNFLKYTIRFKLRSLEGILSDSIFAKVTVDRNLTVPNIDSATPDQANFACDLKMSAARFNHNILYKLDRTYTDAVTTNTVQPSIFVSKDTSVVADNDSVFSWKDDNSLAVHPAARRGVIAGVTYNYTLTAVENTFPGLYPLFGAPAKVSASATCTMANPTIVPTAAPTAGTCYLSMSGNVRSGLTTHWGYSTAGATWTGAGGNGTPEVLNNCTAFGTCTPATVCPTICTQTGLVPGTTYFFAVRDVDPLTGQVGRWSNVVSCKPL
ncbi:hypothetical protein K2P97_02945 [bacterium]|nr:hypothetical protein [bacterium]